MTPDTATRHPINDIKPGHSPSNQLVKGITTKGVVATTGKTIPVGAADNAC